MAEINNINKLIPKICDLHRKREGLNVGEMTQREANLVVCCIEQFEEYLREALAKHLPKTRNCNLSDVIHQVCDNTCSYFGYQCNINRMFEDCKKRK